jgi:hypothetical protein
LIVEGGDIILAAESTDKATSDSVHNRCTDHAVLPLALSFLCMLFKHRMVLHRVNLRDFKTFFFSYGESFKMSLNGLPATNSDSPLSTMRRVIASVVSDKERKQYAKQSLRQ